ncbi:chloramphenicol phosphotransferase CPT [Streptomyces sp. CBMA156]|uniref:chloramphenicol phosphotransferase CPT n=1 Tax=Streptomyces sp. CBMA156 TaxID=1930280 RepID=UPI00166200CC|nr:chloramphenicol phosphotransferase CPT [Streptomyces sp. CBMA156]MBD0669893.1 chloramphenicol phosphotransferase [Streptomyces sp. CBMA156]MBD0670952.1 chloramphenicol phosphotransferase [Streptomyces sp. CBMA156]
MIVLNGGSSSGKSSIAGRLQELLPEPWLHLGTDTMVDALPPSLRSGGEGIGGLEDGDGTVRVGPVFATLDAAWTVGVAAMARAGARIVVDEVFLGGTTSQARWRAALEGLDVLWVGVRCDPAVAAAREAARGDRVAGMAAAQAEPVHRGVAYDLVVDTSRASAADCAQVIAAQVEAARATAGAQPDARAGTAS